MEKLFRGNLTVLEISGHYYATTTQATLRRPAAILSLNPSALMIVRMLSEGHTSHEIFNILQENFSMPPGVFEREIDRIREVTLTIMQDDH